MKLTLDDFKKMEELDQQYFEEGNISPAIEAYKWYLKDENSCVAIKENSKVVAYVNILSLKEDVYNKIKNNEINESEIVVDNLELNKDKYYNYLYFSSIAIDKEYRNIKVLLKLINETKNHIKNIVKNTKVEILEVMADCSSKQGEKLATRFLKLKPYKKTSHNSTIHIISGEEFIKNVKDI